MPKPNLSATNTRELSSSRSLKNPLSPRLSPTSVMNAASVMSSPFASPVIVTSMAAEASIVNESVILNSPSVKRIRLLAPPVNTAGSKVIVSAPSVLLAADIASRNEMPSTPGEAIRLAIEEVSPLTRSNEFPTVTVASNRRSSNASKPCRSLLLVR